jgi:23S rRNA (guanosine2251-2'-O)-methyltransferase
MTGEGGRGGRAAWRPRPPAQQGISPGSFILGGRRAAAEAIRSGRVRRLLVVAGPRETEGLRSVIDAARQAGLSPETVSVEEVERFGVTDHQGVIAFVEPPPELDDRAFAATAFEADALLVVLDGIVDPQNFGACARSSEAAGVAMLVTRKRRAAPLSAGAVRASAGALLHVPVARVPPRPLALVVGAEESGISRLVLEGCDQLVSITMAGRTASLNASAALAVGLFGFALRPR